MVMGMATATRVVGMEASMATSISDESMAM